MKKTNFKKAIAVLLTAILCLTLPGMSAIAAQPDTIAPRNVAVAATDNNLSLGAGGKLTCYAATEVQDGYIAGIIVELQQLDGGWNTIKTWSAADADWAVVYEDWYVAKGYSYRLYITHESYNSNWVKLESFVKESNVVIYQ